MKLLIGLLKNNQFKNIGILTSGVISAQIIGFISQPIATRLYTPSDFGKMAIILSIISLFSSSLNGQYQLSIVTSDSDKEANVITAMSLYFGFVISLLVSCGIVFYSIIRPDEFAELGYWIYITIPLIFASSITNVLTSYNNRYEQYKIIASVSLIRASTSNFIKIFLGILNFGFVGLICSMFVSLFSGFWMQSKYLRKNLKQIFSSSIFEIKGVLVKYKKQPLFSTPGIFAISYSISIVPIFISTLYGVKELGYYALSIANFGLLVTLITNSIGPIYFKQASKEKSETGNFYQSFKSTLLLLFLAAIVPFFVLMFFSEKLFGLVFGQDWIRSGTFTILLIPWQFMNLIVSTFVSSLIISNSQRIKLIIQSFFVVEILIIFYLSKVYKLTIEQFLSTISFAYGFTYLIMLIFIYKKSKDLPLISSKKLIF
tara:strand:+ start:6588 stop:7877 length:1290 start_codon:yes stop_codon:yes gene_type:complete